MRSLCMMLILVAFAASARAEIRSLQACRAEVADAPEAVREQAAQWITLGGGTPARLCEIAALQASGATRVAATKLTELAQSPRAVISSATRALLFSDAGALWLELGEIVLARETLKAAGALEPDAQHYLPDLASVELELGNWAEADVLLTRMIEAVPSADLYRHRASVRRALGRLDAALEDLSQTPETHATRLERAAIWAAQGKTSEAQILLLALIAEADDAAAKAEASAVLSDVVQGVTMAGEGLPPEIGQVAPPRARPREEVPTVRPKPRP